MKTCDTCKFRENGYCMNEEKIHEGRNFTDEDDHLEYSYDEGGAFKVGPKFGCVHHTEDDMREGSLVEP